MLKMNDICFLSGVKIRINNYIAKYKIEKNNIFFYKIVPNKLYYYSLFSFFYLIILVFQLVQLYFLTPDRFQDIISEKSFWLDFILFLFTTYILRHFYFNFNDAIIEIIGRLKSVGNVSKSEISNAESQLHLLMQQTFNPKNLINFGIIGGLFVSLTVIYLEVWKDYPYLIFHFFFGFNHGMGLFICFKGYKFSEKTSSNYVKMVDILDSDGMGGFKRLTKFYVDSVFFMAIFIILDVLILSITFSGGSKIFKLIVQICLLIAIIVSLSTLLISFNKIRTTLIRHKIEKIENIRKRYNEIESLFWENLSNKKDVSSEALTLMSLNEMHEHINKMTMWPLYKIVTKLFLILSSVSYLILQKFVSNDDFKNLIEKLLSLIRS